MRHFLMMLCLMVSAGTVQAADLDLDTLERSGYLQRLDVFGTWQTLRTEQALILTCTDCGGPVKVFILVRDHTESHPNGDLSKSYLEERKAHCQKLVSTRAGRCVGITQTNIRWLAGHRAQAVEEGQYLSEQVLFYAGHALTAIVREEGSFAFGDQLADVLVSALVRITPAW